MRLVVPYALMLVFTSVFTNLIASLHELWEKMSEIRPCFENVITIAFYPEFAASRWAYKYITQGSLFYFTTSMPRVVIQNFE